MASADVAVFDTVLKTSSDQFLSQMIREPLILSKRKLKQLLPYFSATAFIVFTKRPDFMVTKYKLKTAQFFNILQVMNIGVDGFGDDTVQFAEVAFGIPGQQMSIVTGVEDGTQQITVKLPYALTGDPVTKYLMAWINGTIDKHTGIGDYWGQISGGTYEWSPANHTCEWCYWVTDLGSTAANIEYAAYGFNQFPQAIGKGHYNSTHGDRNIQPLNVTFRGQVIDNDPRISTLAKNLMTKINSLRAKNIRSLDVKYDSVGTEAVDKATDNNSMS
jgi:hypothetical protein